MPARLIVNADDFGLTPGINRAIAELHRARVLTSTTLMATAPAFDDAVALARSLPRLGIGCHIVLVDGTPVSEPSEIPTLLGSDRKTFRPTLAAFARDLLLRRIDEADIAQEAAAQIARVRRAGIEITHADTHKHTHIFPAVARALLRYRITPALRDPFEPAFARRFSLVSPRRRLQLAILRRFQNTYRRITHDIPSTDGTLGIASTGNPLVFTALRHLLESLPNDGTFELLCHPGHHDADLDQLPTRLRAHRELERRALLAEIPRILSLPDAPELIHYGNLKP